MQIIKPKFERHRQQADTEFASFSLAGFMTNQPESKETEINYGVGISTLIESGQI